jgi:TP901 family phage tail tape measure protein
MAAFNLTAELNIRGPSNLNRVVADIRRQLSTVSLDVNINPNTSRGIQAVTRDVRDLSAALRDAQSNAVALGAALRGIGGSFNNLSSSVNNIGNSLGRVSTSSTAVSTSIKAASSEMAEFGKQSALAIRRFAAFSVATGAVYTLGKAIASAYSEFVTFNQEFVRLQQVTDTTKAGLGGLASEITRLSTNLGVSSSELLNVSVTLAQAGLSAGETKQALEALAKSALAPSFDGLNETVEGSIALMRQFGIGAGELESALGSVNAVAAKFAVEASDIITAIQRTGGVFAAASQGVSQGKDALNEFLAVFTSVRATTRESAETIATGLRTIFTRIQRTSTIDSLKEFGITLTDLEGKFVGPFEAIRRLSDGLRTLDPRDLRFSEIVEELGGFRQIGKVIPLIQQFATAQQALSVAQKGSGSLANDAATAQEALAVRITKVREQFISLVRDIGQSSNFQAFADVSLKLASALISVADAAKDVLPALAAITAIRGVGALGQFFGGFSGGVSRRPRGFATGGVVPGSGNGDTVPAMLTPGEFVIRKKAVAAIGTSNLHRMNKYAGGGRVKKFARGGIANAPMVDDIIQTSGSILPKPSSIQDLIKAGGGGVDVDRTLIRTTGDKAYSSAPGSSKNAVLSKYFRDDENRLKDIQSSPLTSFGRALQQAIRAGELKAANVSIISKSRRTRGVPEYLSQLFGIPVQNMVFTQGGDKQPAMDAIRSKGPRANRVSRFALGGLVQRFAQKGTGSYRSGTVKPLSPEEQSELSGLLSLEKRWQDSGQKLRAFTSDKQSRLSQLKSRKELGGAQSDEIINGIKLSKTFGVSFLEGGAPDISATISDVLARGNATGVDKLREFIGNKQKARGARITTDGKSSTLSPGGKDIFDRQIMNGLPDLFDNAVAALPEPLRPGRGQVSTDQLISSSARQAVKGYFFEAFIRRASQNLLSDNDTTDAIFDFTGAGNKEALGRLFGGRFVTPNEFKVSPTPENIANAISKAIAISSPSALQYFNSGGSVEDTVPALLTPGEFVINKRAASRLGAAKLNQLNKADKVQGFNKGGVVQRFAGGGSVLPARPENPTRGNTTAVGAAIAAINEMSSALEALGLSASASSRLIEAGGAISIAVSERALQADVNRLRMAGASATDIYRAEQQLANVREQNANKLNTQQIMSGATGGTLQDIQTRAETERERLLDERRTIMASRGRTQQEIEETLANDTGFQDHVRRRSYETATTAVTGAPARSMRDAGVTGADIEQYVNQSMMDRRTLAQMDAQLIRTREQELRSSAAFASASSTEQRRMLGELRARNNEEIRERRNIVNQLAKDRGMTSGLTGAVGRGFRTTGALFGMGTFAENENVPGGGMGGRLNRFSAGAQRAGLGLSLAGGMIGNTIGDAIGGKTGAGIGAATSAFASSVGVGAMFGPVGALAGVVTGATAAIKAWTDAVSDATLAEEASKTEKASIKIQKGFEKLEKSTTNAESSSLIKDIVDNLRSTSGSFSRSVNSTTDKIAPASGWSGFFADLGNSTANITSEIASQGFESLGNILKSGLNLTGLTNMPIQDTPANFNGFRREIDTNQLGKEIAALARNSQVNRDLPQLFEQGLRKGRTFEQISAEIGPDSLASMKEIFAVSQGNETITSLMADRSAARQQLSQADTDEDRDRIKRRIDNLNKLIRRIAEESFNNDIKKSIVDKIAAEKKLEQAAASATVRINLFASVLNDISSAVNKAGVDFQAAQRQIEINLGSAFGDQVQMAGPDRRNENVLENMSAYSVEAIRSEIGKIGSDLKFNPAVVQEAQSAATNKKILETELPKILSEIAAKEKKGFDPEGSAAQVIRNRLSTVLEGKVDDPNAIISNVIAKITEKIQTNSRQGLTVEELSKDNNAINEILSSDTKTLEIFNNLIKMANDQVAALTASFNRFSGQLNRFSELQIQKENIGIEGENQLTQALGGNLSLFDMNEPFENAIDILTSRIGADGRPARGTGTLDPAQIMQRMLEKEAEAANIQKQLDQERPSVDSARFKELNSSLARTTAEARNLQTAHQKLATDSSRASNALAKIGEIRQQNENRQSMFLEILKNANNPEWQMEFINSVDNYQRVMAGQNVGPDGWASAVQGLENALRANPRDAKDIQEKFIQNAANLQGLDKNFVQNMMNSIGIGLGEPSPEMKGLIDEFYRFNEVQQEAINQSAERIITAGKEFLTAVNQAGANWNATVGAGGQRDPSVVKPANPPRLARGGVVYAQDGGHMVNFQPRGTDTVPAMLTPGEFVVNRKAAAKNMGLLKAINSGAKGYSRGGIVYLQQGGYVPKDTTIDADAKALEVEMNTEYAAVDQKIAENDALMALLRSDYANIPEGPQKEAILEKIRQTYVANGELQTQRKQIEESFIPRMDQIRERRDLERDRRIAGTGELNMFDMESLDTTDIPGDELRFKGMDFATGRVDLNRLTLEEQKQYETYQAEVEKRKQARIQKAKDRVASVDGPPAATSSAPQQEPELTKDFLIGGYKPKPIGMGPDSNKPDSGKPPIQRGPYDPNKPDDGRPAMEMLSGSDVTPEERIAARRNAARQAYLADKNQKRANFLANNPFYAKKEQEKQQRAQQEQKDALAWKQKQLGPNAKISSEETQDIIKEHRAMKREERAKKERLATYGTEDKLSPEKAREILDEKRGAALAKRFGWKADSIAGTYEGGDRLEPQEVTRLPAKDRELLTQYQNAQIAKAAEAERNKKKSEMVAAREKEDATFRASLDKKAEESMATYRSNKAKETQLQQEADKKKQEEAGAAAIAKKAADEKRLQDSIKAQNAEYEAQKLAKEQKKLKEEAEARDLKEAQVTAVENAVQIDPVSRQIININPDQVNSRVAELREKKKAKLDPFVAGGKRSGASKPRTEADLAKIDPEFAQLNKELEREELVKAGIDRARTKFDEKRAEENLATQDRYEELKSLADKNKLSPQDSQEYATLAIKRGVKPSEIAGGGAVRAERVLRDDALGYETRQQLEQTELDTYRKKYGERKSVIDQVLDEAAASAGSGVEGLTGSKTLGTIAQTVARIGVGALDPAEMAVGIGTGGIGKALSAAQDVANSGKAVANAKGIAARAAQNPSRYTPGTLRLPKSTKAANPRSVLDEAGNFRSQKDVEAAREARKIERHARKDAGIARAVKVEDQKASQFLEEAGDSVDNSVSSSPNETKDLSLFDGREVSPNSVPWVAREKTRSSLELAWAVEDGKKMAESFKRQGIEMPDFTSPSPATTSRTTAATRAASTKTGGSTRTSLSQAIAEADKDEILKKYGSGGEGKYGGSNRYDLSKEAAEGPITAKERKEAIKSVKDAKKTAEIRATQKASADRSVEEQTYAALQRLEKDKSNRRSLVRSGVGAAGAGAVAYNKDALANAIVSEEEMRRQIRKARGMSTGGVVYAAKGQLIPFTPKGTDTVPAMLTPGEFVINRAATQKHLPLLKAINNNQVPGYAKGGKVRYFSGGSDGPISPSSGGSGGGGGVSNISLDTSGLDTAFNSFATNVESLKSVMDSFAAAASSISGGFSQLSQLEAGANRIGTAATSISAASQTFGSVIANFNTSIAAMQEAFSKIPSAVDFRVSGSVPINITVDVNGGDGLQDSLAQFQDQIFTEISNGISNAMPGVNISFTRTT